MAGEGQAVAGMLCCAMYLPGLPVGLPSQRGHPLQQVCLQPQPLAIQQQQLQPQQVPHAAAAQPPGGVGPQQVQVMLA
jgi:hypothetical protein